VDDAVGLAASETGMAGCPYCVLLTIAAFAVNYLDCDADVSATHLQRHDVMAAASQTACQRQLTDDIEACLSGYERLLVSSRALDRQPGQLQRPVARRLCRLVRQFAVHYVRDRDIFPWRYFPGQFLSRTFSWTISASAGTQFPSLIIHSL